MTNSTPDFKFILGEELPKDLFNNKISMETIKPDDLLQVLNDLFSIPNPHKFNVVHLTTVGTANCLPLLNKHFKIIYTSLNENHYIVKIPQVIPLDIIQSMRGVLKVVFLFEETR